MISTYRHLALAVALLAGTPQAGAQKQFRLNRLIDSTLMKRYTRANIDTNYVVRPRTRWTLTTRLNVAGATISTEGTDQGSRFQSEMEAERKTTLSLGVSYLGLSVSLSLNPAKMLGQYHDYEVGFRSYGRRFGFDIAYQDAGNWEGWEETDGVRQRFTTSEEMFKLRTLNANAYYAFNHRRFSYPAALSHGYIQRRSAGSFLLAVSLQGQHGEADAEAIYMDDEQPAAPGQNTAEDVTERMDLKMTNVGIGAGYGYNFVPASGWLLHLSSLPTFIVYTNTSLSMGDVRYPLRYHFPEVIITGRGAVVKQLGSNMFAGFSMVYYFTNIGHKDNLSIHNEKWLTRLYLGFRL